MKRLLFLTLLLLFFTSCINTVRVGEVVNEKRQVLIGDVERVDVDINMGAGTLNISGGAESLMEASLWYNVTEWEPEITYDDSGDTGKLEIRQPSTGDINWSSDIEYDWNLLFNDDTPLNMNARLGAGEGSFALWTLNLDELNIETGAGETVIDLHGGQVQELDVTMGAGELRLNLSGSWDHDMHGSIRGGVGDLLVTLPENTNVDVTVQGGLGSVNADGLLTRDGSHYSHDAGSEHTITLDIEGGVGTITLAVAE